MPAASGTFSTLCANAIASSSARAVPCQEFVVSNVSAIVWAPVPEPPPSIVTAGMPRLMAMFESVDPSSRLGCTPSARVTETAARTIGASAATAPAGRWPTTVFSIVNRPLFPHRSFSSASATSSAFWNPASSAVRAAAIGRAHVDLHPRVGRDRVDGRPAADAADVEGGLRQPRNLDVRDAADGAAERVNRVGDPEGAVAVAARPLERDAIAQAADRDVRDPEPRPVNRDEPIDPAFEFLVEEVLDAAQIAEPFLPYRAHERDAARRLDGRRIHGADDAEQNGKAAAVVADAGPFDDRAGAGRLDVGLFGKDGVEMGGEHQVRRGCEAGALAEHVADAVDPHVFQPGRLKGLPVGLAPGRFP